jgi:hypothetical protein
MSGSTSKRLSEVCYFERAKQILLGEHLGALPDRQRQYDRQQIRAVVIVVELSARRVLDRTIEYHCHISDGGTPALAPNGAASNPEVIVNRSRMVMSRTWGSMVGSNTSDRSSESF